MSTKSSNSVASSAFLNPIFRKIFKYDVLLLDETGDLKIEAKDKAIISLNTSLICILIYQISSIVFYNMSISYKNMIKKDQMFWNLAIVRGVYGAFGVTLSLYERYFDAELFKHITKSKTELSYFLVLSHLGFFIFEWGTQVYFDIRFNSFNKELHAHHLISFLGYWLTVTTNRGHYTGCSSFILEMTTPFSCICFCLIKSKLQDTLLWKLNQMILIHLFHMRSIIEMSISYEYFKYFDEFRQLNLLWNIVYPGGMMIIMVFLTPYWTYKKTEQLFTKKDFSVKESKKEN